MTRRQAIKTTALASAALTILPNLNAQTTNGFTTAAYPQFELPLLPYAYDALEPFIDAQTMQIHHDKHHAAYVANLNKALEIKGGIKLSGATLLAIESILKDLNSVHENVRTAVRNNGGGHYNHSLFWQMMKKGGGGEPTGELAKAIDTAFGSFSTFKDNFTKAALGQFGSGWAWLVLDGTTTKIPQLKIEQTSNQDSPISQTATALNGTTIFKTPLLGLDVWEHAYYLKYQNKRADYITAWFNVVNWDFVAERYAKSKA